MFWVGASTKIQAEVNSRGTLTKLSSPWDTGPPLPWDTGSESSPWDTAKHLMSTPRATAAPPVGH